MPNHGTKQCTLCGEVKSAHEFGLLASSPDGRRSRCRACQNLPAGERDGTESGEDNTLRQYHRAYYQRNRERLLEAKRKRYAQVPAEERRRQRQRDYLRSRYGLGPDEWMLLWERQDGRCYLCGSEMDAEKERIVIEHDHSCCPGYRPCGLCIRGLTHVACNTAIGHAGDDPVRMRRMADALEAAQGAVAQRRAGAEERI